MTQGRSAYLLLIILFLGSFSHALAQKKRIIIVPYTRFQFTSEFNLDEIANHNNTSSSNVFELYQKEMNVAFANYKNNDFEFVPISASSYQKHKRFIQYKLDKFNGKKYNSSNLKSFDNEDFKAFLVTNNADYVVFINWYSIQKSVFTTYMGDRNKRNKYSTHLIDYDVYNNEKVKILGKGNIELDCGSFPSASIIEHKCLNAEELKNCYANFLNEICQELLSGY